MTGGGNRQGMRNAAIERVSWCCVYVVDGEWTHFSAFSPRVLISGGCGETVGTSLSELGRCRIVLIRKCVIHRYGRDSFPRLGPICAWRVGFFHQSAERFDMQHSHGDDVVVISCMKDFQDLNSSGFIFCVGCCVYERWLTPSLGWSELSRDNSS